MPEAASADEIAAQLFCGVGKKPAAGNTQTQDTLVALGATLIDVGDNVYYLVLSSGAGSSQASTGTRSGDSYSFTSTSSSTVTTPRNYVREQKTIIELRLSGQRVSGTLTQSTTYTCTGSGCSTDFAQRCPACVAPTAFTGVEKFNVTDIRF